jgi:hypothetical protein
MTRPARAVRTVPAPPRALEPQTGSGALVVVAHASAAARGWDDGAVRDAR